MLSLFLKKKDEDISTNCKLQKKEIVGLHFEVDQEIGPKETAHFKNIDEAKGAPLIQQLFYLPFVKSVRLSETTI